MKTMSIAALKGTITRAASLAKLKIVQRSPEILLGAGVVSVIAGTVLACRATLKVEGILDEHAEKKSDIDYALNNDAISYDENDAKKDKTVLMVQTGGKLVLNYAPGAGLVLFGIGCFAASYGIMRKRNVALMGAYKALEGAFEAYRARVAAEIGEEREKELYGGYRTLEVIDPETGEITKEKISEGGAVRISPYARFFDESSMNWVNDPCKNKFTLKLVQNMANDRLAARGYLFLNEVYEMLGFPAEMNTDAGQIVGWVYGVGDGYVDFNIFQTCTDNELVNEARQRFTNELEPSVLLDFNVHGPIMDLVFRKKQ